MSAPQRPSTPFKAVVLTMPSGLMSGLYKSISHVMGVMTVHLLPAGQQIRVVLPALLRQVEPFSQQKLSGQWFAAF